MRFKLFSCRPLVGNIGKGFRKTDDNSFLTWTVFKFSCIEGWDKNKVLRFWGQIVFICFNSGKNRSFWIMSVSFDDEWFIYAYKIFKACTGWGLLIKFKTPKIFKVIKYFEKLKISDRFCAIFTYYSWKN